MGARSLIARMFGRDLPAPAPDRVEPVIVRNAPLRPAGRRNGFAAAQWDRLTYDWGVTPQALDIFLRQGLRGLRARSRSLAINNDYMRQFLRRVRTNVIGAEGFSLQVAAEDSPGKPDEKANDKIKAEWDAFGKLGACTVCGRFSWTELQQLVITSLARDGEVLLREAHDLCGLPVSVFRCDMILADTSYAGQLNLPDMFTRMMLSLVATGIAPGSFHELDAAGDRQRFSLVPGDRR